MYISADTVIIGNVNSYGGLYVTTEFLNSINLSGLPPPPHRSIDGESRMCDDVVEKLKPESLLRS